MIEELAKRLVTWQVKRNYLSSEDQRLYQYAYELLIGQVVNILIACLLAVIFQAYTTVFVFLVFFIPLRSFAGGHHADSFNTCTMVSTLMLCAVCIMEKRIPEGAVFAVDLLASGLCGICIFLLAPVEDHNKPFDQAERIRYRNRSRGIWGVEVLLWLLCYGIGAGRISLAAALGHLAVAVLLCAGAIKNKKRKNHVCEP